MINYTDLPEGWKIAAYTAADQPNDLWITVTGPSFGELSKLCTKPNERRMARALIEHAAPAGVAADGDAWEQVARDILANARPIEEIKHDIADIRERLALSVTASDHPVIGDQTPMPSDKTPGG